MDELLKPLLLVCAVNMEVKKSKVMQMNVLLNLPRCGTCTFRILSFETMSVGVYIAAH